MDPKMRGPGGKMKEHGKLWVQGMDNFMKNYQAESFGFAYCSITFNCFLCKYCTVHLSFQFFYGPLVWVCHPICMQCRNWARFVVTLDGVLLGLSTSFFSPGHALISNRNTPAYFRFPPSCFHCFHLVRNIMIFFIVIDTENRLFCAHPQAEQKGAFKQTAAPLMNTSIMMNSSGNHSQLKETKRFLSPTSRANEPNY